MTAEHTEQQSSDAQRRAKELSLKSTTPPADVSGYETQKFLGSGAFGEVWAGIDQNTGRQVAIKFYTHRGGVDWTLLSREVEKLAVLSADRYVVQLLDVGWDSDPPYYVMDYIENGSLEDLLNREGSLPLADAVEIFQEVAVGLMHLHGKGVLHCDLKPANVLLDEDDKPRLADFGQSRLTSEQQPALGTLFYMAPEQADLEAVPDARWDVYALGALLYCMLSGSPPFRSDEVINQIDSASNLPDRLASYRKAIESAPRPAGHRQVPGMDRGLNEIIDRCLAVDPNERFPSVQSVLEGLKARDDARVRTPLFLLGFVGPLVLLSLMALFGWRGYQQAKEQSTDAVRRRAFVSNRFAATFIARTLESEIERNFEIVESEVSREEFRETFFQASKLSVLGQLDQTQLPDDKRKAIRQQFLDDETRILLRDYLDRRLKSHLARLEKFPHAPKFASIFVVDKQGIILATVYDPPQFATKSVGRNYAWRTYFHGGPVDLPRDQRPPQVQHIEQSHLSAAFQSTTTKTWKVAVSTPIFQNPDDPESFAGVMVFTVNTGDFDFLKQEKKTGEQDDDLQLDRVAVLVDPREAKGGTILQHQLYTNGASDDPNAPPPDYSPYRVPHDDLQQIEKGNWQFQYRDPLAEADWGAPSGGIWIAAMAGVHLPHLTSSKRNGDDKPDMIVLVQQKEEAVTSPVRELGNRLVNEGLRALTAVLLTVCVLWYFVVRKLGGMRRTKVQSLGDRPTTRSLHSMDTLTAPPHEGK